MRADEQPRWMIMAGAMHDLGKILCLWGEPQWAVVGDTYPVGCAFSDTVVFSEYFADNPDSADPVKSTHDGLYEPGCGFDQVVMSWGHDEYIRPTATHHRPEGRNAERIPLGVGREQVPYLTAQSGQITGRVQPTGA